MSKVITILVIVLVSASAGQVGQWHYTGRELQGPLHRKGELKQEDE